MSSCGALDMLKGCHSKSDSFGMHTKTYCPALYWNLPFGKDRTVTPPGTDLIDAELGFFHKARYT